MGEGGFSHSLSVIFVEVKVIICEQKNLDTDVTSNQTQNPRNESSLPNREISKSPELCVYIYIDIFSPSKLVLAVRNLASS
jgi:hypothetical protein